MVESVQRHSERDAVPTDYSLAGIDLKRVRHTLSEIIQSNKERWKELSVQGVCSQHRHITLAIPAYINVLICIFTNKSQM